MSLLEVTVTAIVITWCEDFETNAVLGVPGRRNHLQPFTFCKNANFVKLCKDDEVRTMFFKPLISHKINSTPAIFCRELLQKNMVPKLFAKS